VAWGAFSPIFHTMNAPFLKFSEIEQPASLSVEKNCVGSLTNFFPKDNLTTPNIHCLKIEAFEHDSYNKTITIIVESQKRISDSLKMHC